MSTTDPSDNFSFDSHLTPILSQDEIPLQTDQTANFATPVPCEHPAGPSQDDADATAHGGSRGNNVERSDRKLASVDAEAPNLPQLSTGNSKPTDPAYSQRYERRGELGRGGWGVVERVHDKQLQRDVAVKRITIPEDVSDEAKERFLHEAKITSQLQHPGVVPVHELVVGENQQSTYYVMKLLEGETLRDHIRARHQIKSSKQTVQNPTVLKSSHELLDRVTPLLERFIDVCNAVAYAHQRGVIHRDLKPANIMVGAFGETIVVDWGLAIQEHEHHPAELEEQTVAGGSALPSRNSSGFSETDGTVIGTPAYMSPEQARGDLLSLGASSDIYSLGIVLWEIVVGQHPYRGQKVDTILQDVSESKLPCIKDQQPLVTKPLMAILEKALGATPDDRYWTATELGNDVRQFMLGEPVSVYKEPVVDKVWRWCRRNRSMVVMISMTTIVLLLASLIFGYFINLSRQAELNAKLAAHAAHETALNRLVESRDAADSWLIDLSGSLEFYPGLGSIRKQLLLDAIEQYERIVDLSRNSDSRSIPADPKLKSLMDLENARCHLRLGDLYFLVGENEKSKAGFQQAESMLNSIAKRVSTLSGEPVDAQGIELSQWIQLEQANAKMGLAFHNSETIERPEFRDQRRWFQMFVPDDEEQAKNAMFSEDRLEPFRIKAVSAAIRFELIAHRFNTQSDNAAELATSRLERASNWARWLAVVDGKPSAQRLYLTAQQTLAHYAYQSDQTDIASLAWSRLVSDMSGWIPKDEPRPDQLQALAHARLMKLKLDSHSQLAESEYRTAINELNQAWSLSDSDSFYRTNLATAEFCLAQAMVKNQTPDSPEKSTEAGILLQRALATYQELLQENVTVDRLRRLAETHFCLANLKASERTEPASQMANTEHKRHLQSGNLAYQMIFDHGGLEVDDALNWFDLILSSTETADLQGSETASYKSKSHDLAVFMKQQKLSEAQSKRWSNLQQRASELSKGKRTDEKQ